MRQLAVVLVVALAGCDGVFNLDELHVPVDAAVPADPADGRLDGSQLDDGLILHLPFDGDLMETVSGAKASCASGTSSCPQFAPGHAGSAAAYDGADDCLTANLAVVGTVFTVSLWFNVATDTSVSLISKPYTSTLDSWQIDTDTGHTLRFISFASNTANAVVVNSVFTESTWTHVAITYDGSARQIFVSGLLRMTDGPSQFSVNTDPVYIGCDRDSGSPTHRMAGMLDDVRVYSRVLTAAEIGALANM